MGTNQALHTEWAGQSKPTLYLLSGNGSTKAWFDDALPYFRDKLPVPLELPGYGDNTSNAHGSLGELAEALIAMTTPGQAIFVVGINALVVLHALVRKPGHFAHVYMLAPVGAFLEERRFVALMRGPMMAKSAHFMLRNFPKLFRNKFSSKPWTDAQYRRMGEGYRKCKAFQDYFRFVQGWNATDLFEWIDDPITLIWGAGDAVLDLKQVAAWDTLLPRAPLDVCIKPDWEHYPYIDNPGEFASFMEGLMDGRPPIVEGAIPIFSAHTKAGRLQLATLAGLPVPGQHAVRSADDAKAVAQRVDPNGLYAVRSSGAQEDHIDHSNAGIHTTFLRVPQPEVEARAMELLGMGLETVVVQSFVEPVVSGVAFVRRVSAEMELVAGHLEGLVSGTLDPLRITKSRLGAVWESGDLKVGEKSDTQSDDSPAHKIAAVLTQHPKARSLEDFVNELWDFLQGCIRAFHYAHSDIEWAWDGHQFWMLQIRPVTTYLWRRSLSTANLNEILPPQVSRIMEHAQRRASLSIGRLYSLWDRRNIRDNEPFTAVSEDASYLNLDLFLARFHDWGLPSKLISGEIGGAAPPMPFQLGRFLRSVPTFLRMQRRTRREILRTSAQLQAFERELEILEIAGDKDAIAQWFVRYYVFIVRQNMVINACLSAAMGSFLGKPKTVYAQLAAESEKGLDGHSSKGNSPGSSVLHRLKFESDPASVRVDGVAPELQPFPRWSWWIRTLHRLGAPGLGGKYFEVREWFRDNNMRLFFRLHHALKGSEWLTPHPGVRTRSGAFWQDGSGQLQQTNGFVIHPGSAEGFSGVDIMVVDALDPGHYEEYKRAKAVIARTGGRLSHGATLLRELKKPSAVLPDAPDFLEGTYLVYADGVLSKKQP